MKYNSIADIYSANALARERFLNVVGSISADEAKVVADGEKWPLDHIIEHVSIVENSMLRICTKLVSEARSAGTPSDGTFNISENLMGKFAEISTIKVEAPERVHPSGSIPIADSLANMEVTSKAIEGLRRDLELFDGTANTFPHPYFGELTAAEWMVVRGGHESRHTDQIVRVLDKIRK